MRKNKLYIITFILTIILIFSTAFTLNLCGMPVEIETEEEEEAAPPEDVETKPSGSPEEEAELAEERKVAEEEGEEIEEVEEEEEVVEEAAPEEEVSGEAEVAEKEEEKTPPTIELKIYEGPTYSAADDVCFYRIEATVTGNPAPTVSFNRDDSGSAWGSKKVQINLKRNSPTYTLTATATNSSGSATDSINLSWGCNGEEVVEEEPEEGVPLEPGNHPPVLTRVGTVGINLSDTVSVGDTFTIRAEGDDPDGDIIIVELTDYSGLKWVAEGHSEPVAYAVFQAKVPGDYIKTVYLKDINGAKSDSIDINFTIVGDISVNEPIYIPQIITIPINHPPEIIDAWAEPNTVSVGEIFTVYAAGNDPDGDTIVIGTSYSPDQFKLMGWPQWGEMSADFKALKLGNYKIEVYLLDGAEYSDRRIDVNITVEE